MDITDILIELGTMADDERRRLLENEHAAAPTAWVGREHAESIRQIYAERAERGRRRLEALRHAIRITKLDDFAMPSGEVLKNLSDGSWIERNPSTGAEHHRTLIPSDDDRAFLESEFGRGKDDA